jgi:hypothetical protein
MVLTFTLARFGGQGQRDKEEPALFGKKGSLLTKSVEKKSMIDLVSIIISIIISLDSLMAPIDVYGGN